MRNPFQLSIPIPLPSLTRRKSNKCKRTQGEDDASSIGGTMTPASASASSPFVFPTSSAQSAPQSPLPSRLDTPALVHPCSASYSPANSHNSYFPPTPSTSSEYDSSYSAYSSASSSSSSFASSSRSRSSSPKVRPASCFDTEASSIDYCSTPSADVYPAIKIQPLAVTVGPTQLRSAIRMAKEARQLSEGTQTQSAQKKESGRKSGSSSSSSSKRRPSTAPTADNSSRLTVTNPAMPRRASARDSTMRTLHTVEEDGECA